MAVIVSIATALVILFVVFRLRANFRDLKRAEYIRSFAFPRGLFQKLVEKHPGIEQRDAALVSRGLRQFFLAYLKSKRQFVSMPSQAADDLWHEFILYTRDYAEFCQRAFGGFLHHTPAAVLGADKRSNAGLRRTWWWACKDENIHPARPARLPLLFALDAKLKIANGFVYAANCSVLRRNGDAGTWCAGDFSSSSVDGSTSGFGDGDGLVPDRGTAAAGSDGVSGSVSDSGSDSGSSCGGGGCGGGE